GTEKISKMDCWKIEATPKSEVISRKSGYSKRILFVLKNLFMTVKIEFYDKRKVHVKTLVVSKLNKIDKNRYRPDKSIMINHTTGHRTELQVTNREIDVIINSDYFHERFITSNRHMQ
ncbi:MAG: outer membrane lipoprotein-sorting protein, partial [Spirochaetales bacterium]|nr:outer membrane lipoprotein-sorting protein [Spirochaetales bacterium]